MPTDVTITILITNDAPATVQVSDNAASRQEWDIPLPDEPDDQQEAYPPLPDDELKEPNADLELPADDDQPDDATPAPGSAS